MGLECLKFEPPGEDGWPDRQVILPDRAVCWVELKREGEEPTALQGQRMAWLNGIGHDAAWFDDADEALEFVRDCLARCRARRMG